MKARLVPCVQVVIEEDHEREFFKSGPAVYSLRGFGVSGMGGHTAFYLPEDAAQIERWLRDRGIVPEEGVS